MVFILDRMQTEQLVTSLQQQPYSLQKIETSARETARIFCAADPQKMSELYADRTWNGQLRDLINTAHLSSQFLLRYFEQLDQDLSQVSTRLVKIDTTCHEIIWLLELRYFVALQLGLQVDHFISQDQLFDINFIRETFLPQLYVTTILIEESFPLAFSNYCADIELNQETFDILETVGNYIKPILVFFGNAYSAQPLPSSHPTPAELAQR